jgi:hypothetical protein
VVIAPNIAASGEGPCFIIACKPGLLLVMAYAGSKGSDLLEQYIFCSILTSCTARGSGIHAMLARPKCFTGHANGTLARLQLQCWMEFMSGMQSILS